MLECQSPGAEGRGFGALERHIGFLTHACCAQEQVPATGLDALAVAAPSRILHKGALLKALRPQSTPDESRHPRELQPWQLLQAVS